MTTVTVQFQPLFDAIESREIVADNREYLGISGLGGECNRQKWYAFHWAYSSTFSPRLKRLFARGDQEEEVIVNDLTNAGISCHHVLDSQAEVSACNGHLKGHPDGSIDNVPGDPETIHLLEMKTANAKSFAKFSREGVRTHSKYYVQIQMYLRYLNLQKCIFIMTNKNTDDRIYELVYYDQATADYWEQVAAYIIATPEPPPKLSNKPDYYLCRWCDAKHVCHHNQQPLWNCRTCEHSTPGLDATWHCRIHTHAPIPVSFQRVGCPDHYKRRI